MLDAGCWNSLCQALSASYIYKLLHILKTLKTPSVFTSITITINFTFLKLFQQTNSSKSWKLCTVQYIGCREVVLGTIHWMKRNSFTELKEGLSL